MVRTYTCTNIILFTLLQDSNTGYSTWYRHTHTTWYKYTEPHAQIHHKPKYSTNSRMQGKTLA